MNLRSILELDAHLSDRMRVAEKPGLLRSLAVFFAHSGDSWFWGLGLILLWWLGDSFWKQWALVLFAGIAALAVIVISIKFTVRRRRPEGEWGAFLIAVFSIGLGPAWLATLLCIWAPLVSLARVSMGVHYVSDVIAGAILGVIVGLVGLQFAPAFLSWISSFPIPLF
jgi:hypothetical protein